MAAAAEDSAPGAALVRTRNRFLVGDILEVVSPGKTGRSFKIGQIRDEGGNDLSVSNTPMRLLTIDCPFEVQAGDLFRKPLA